MDQMHALVYIMQTHSSTIYRVLHHILLFASNRVTQVCIGITYTCKGSLKWRNIPYRTVYVTHPGVGTPAKFERFSEAG